MKLVGLTGGIASGKSTVSKMFQEEGFPIIDADRICHFLLNLGEATQQKVAAEFPEATRPDGSIDRKKLAGIVFPSPDRRKVLEDIIHPKVAWAVQCDAAHLSSAGYKVAIYDAPLLIEAGHHKDPGLNLSSIILVYVPEWVQVKRAVERGHDEADVRLRMAAQMPIEEKRQFARYEINNAGSLSFTRERVAYIASELRSL